MVSSWLLCPFPFRLPWAFPFRLPWALADWPLEGVFFPGYESKTALAPVTRSPPTLPFDGRASQRGCVTVPRMPPGEGHPGCRRVGRGGSGEHRRPRSRFAPSQLCGLGGDDDDEGGNSHHYLCPDCVEHHRHNSSDLPNGCVKGVLSLPSSCRRGSGSSRNSWALGSRVEIQAHSS